MPTGPYNLRGQGAAGGDHEAEAGDGGSVRSPRGEIGQGFIELPYTYEIQ